jgi:type I restriction enzyme M protein
MFYNTGIATYIWVLSNRKPAHRRGQVQLIDATGWYTPLRKNLGQKNCELSEEDIHRIVEAFLIFEESEQSKIFPNQAFGYWKITVERPLRLRVDLSEPTLAHLRRTCQAEGEEGLAAAVDWVAANLGPGPHGDYNAFLDAVESAAGSGLTKKRQKLLQDALAERDESAQPVVKTTHKRGKVEADPLYGRYAAQVDGKSRVVEYEVDSDRRIPSRSPCWRKAASRPSSSAKCCPTCPTPGSTSPKRASATRSPSTAISTSPSLCAAWPRSAPTSRHWNARRMDF